MQGTVAEFDPATGAGSLLLDDGRPVEFDGAAFDASGLRLLRVGQRVHIDRSPNGYVTRITLVTLQAE